METKKRILVADDDSELRELLTYYLAKLGHDVIQAENGPDALATGLKGGLDLIVLDVMMPDMDGYHVAQNLTEKLGDTRPRLLIMTSRDLESDRGLTLLSGTDATIQKPFKLNEFKEVVAKLL